MTRNLHFDLLAPLYDRVIAKRDAQVYLDLLRLPVNDWMLDVGGGTGRASALLRSSVRHLVVCDLSFFMLRQAQQKDAFLPVQARAQRLPFPDATFGRILVVDALHHFDDQAGAIHSLLRVLKPGGIMLIEEPDISRLPVKLVALMEKLALMGSHIHSAAEIMAMVRRAGAAAQIHSDGNNTVGVSAAK